MKKLLLSITFLLTTLIGFSQAGDICFLHTATAANISNAVTYIDHPALNDNPGAIILVTHNMISDGTYNANDKVTGVFYSTSENKWSVYNEDLTNMEESMSFNIYVKGTEGKAITVTKPSGSTFWFHVDNAVLNGNANAHPIITNNWHPNSIANNNIYGWDYVDPEWRLYSESGTLPDDASFNILMEPAFLSYEPSLAFTHQATAANIIYSNATEIDHPLLNDKPDALFVVTHSHDAPGTTGSAMNVQHNLAAYYATATGRWHIAFEDVAAFQEGAAFNVVLPHPAPENDSPDTSITVSVGAHGSTCSTPTIMTNVGATDSSGSFGLVDPTCGDYAGGDIFYLFNVPTSGQVKIHRTNDGNWDYLKYSLYQPNWGNEVACGEIASGTTESDIITGLTPGSPCGLRLWEFNNNDFGTEGFCIIEHDPTASIADAVIDGFSMYPNPVNDILNIETTNEVTAVSIYNILGQEVINTTKTQIDMSSLPAGSYVVKVQAGNQVGAYNLIKQ